MEMKLQQQQRQTLQLVMTTELRQAIALLQYTNYELYQYIEEQQLENPLIELEEKEDKYFNKNRDTKGKSVDYSPRVDPVDFIANNDQCMYRDLMEQSQWMDMKEKERDLVHYLIQSLDENGYLQVSEHEIAADLQIDEEEVLKGITLLQQLEPIGVGARDLKECLLLQIRYYHPEEEVAEQIVMDYLDLLANKKWHDIAKRLDITLEEVKWAYEFIQTLDPKPCTILSNTPTEYLQPDVIVDQINGKFIVQLNDSYLPEVRFNSQYANLAHDNQANKYIQDKTRSYQWLINSIEQRRQTILKITHVVLQKQYGFFANGLSELRPLTLKDVAEEIDMHESTVSRATANKVIQTPNGSFEFRIFFTSKLNTQNGSAMSQTKMKIMLADFVKGENKYKPFSDQKIAEHFQTKKGITISRRTIAKYREDLKIPSSSKRKEIKI